MARKKKRRTKKQAPQVWKEFEDVVRSIVNMHSEAFGLDSVEPSAAKILGQSGYVWTIEIVGYCKGSKKIAIFEVRRKKRNIEPEEVSGLRGRIEDTQAGKGYIVTKLNRRLSIGSQKLADFNKIEHIQVSADATPDVYVMRYLRQFFVGLSDTMQPSDSVEAIVRDREGKIIQKINSTLTDKPRPE
jgi:hypothetical protein